MTTATCQSCKGKSSVHFIANCTVCDWSSSDYLRGQVKASAHARETGHVVQAELGYVVWYGDKQ